MNKTCSKCEDVKDISEFSLKSASKDGYSSRCKICMRKYYHNRKEFYNRNTLSNKKKIIEKNRRNMIEFLKDKKCVDCNIQDIRVLEFDHIKDNKKADIAKLLRDGYSWRTICNEISKCEVRCANCHRIKTYERSNSYRSRLIID